MVSVILLLPAGLILAYLFNVYRCFARNLAAAKQSGIPYASLPLYTFSRAWLVTHDLWLPVLRKIPGSSKWTRFLNPEFTWYERYDSFRSFNSDIFLLVSPGRNHLFVADPQVISQIVTRRNDFPKPIEMYRSVDLFGKNVVSTEGSIWRHHRKITSPPFTEKNNHLVWTESLYQAQSMLTSWVGENGNDQRTVWTLAADAMRLSLNVISRAGFGVQLKWPHEEGTQDALERRGRMGLENLPPGHTMSYKDALSILLDNIIWVILMPRWMLRNSFLKVHKRSYEALVEWGKYMNEMYAAKQAEVAKGETTEGMDLMGALVRGAGFTEENSKESADASSRKGPSAGQRMLSDGEILGNAFVFILAGHETTANSIHFSLLYLAMNPHSQRHAQSDVDKIFGRRPISEWDYEVDCPKLFGSMIGAILNEELRLIPPVINIPKSTPPGQAQAMNFAGRKVIVPGGASISLSTAAIHRNPKYWPAGPSRPRIVPRTSPVSKSSISKPTLVSSTYKGSTVPLPAQASIEDQDLEDDKASNDLDEFKPERWLVDPTKSNNDTGLEEQESYEEIGGPQGHDTSSQLLRPLRGAYIPFSEGYRACLGRRFAQVEVLAVLAVILRDYSVELAVDEWASDEEVAAMPKNGEERRGVWGKAEERARWLLKDGMMSIITIQMRKGKVPVRFVKRGNERFGFGEED